MSLVTISYVTFMKSPELCWFSEQWLDQKVVRAGDEDTNKNGLKVFQLCKPQNQI